MSDELPFIDPTRGGSKVRLQRAPRPMDLAGKVVGLLDNTKEQGDLILAAVGEGLRERHGVAKVVSRRKAFFSRPADPALLDEMANEVQVAVAALGG
ncbi:MAG: hypothetical protein GEV05_28410 [Betaproteobacteria bacterium]|nr:hypothetical protein [Betaproteobacteria bacterium]